MPGFPSSVGLLLLLVMYVCLGLQEKGIECGRCFYAHSLGKVAAGTEPTLEQVFLHVVCCQDLDHFFVKALDVRSQRFISSLYDCLE